MRTPEFVMPPEPVEPVEPPEPPAAPPRSSPTAAAEASAPSVDRDDAVLVRERPVWQRLLVAALLGVLLGAAALAFAQQADRTAADARLESLGATAQRYLDAIAGRDAELATAIAPVDGEAASAAVLEAAEPITGVEVAFVLQERGAGSVEVRYQVGSVREQRTLGAAHGAGGWRLTTSLAEPVVVHVPDGSAGARVGGAELPPSRAVLLYPGRYQLDAVSTGLLRSGGERFEVDGDPESQVELHSSLEPSERLRNAATAVAATRVAACQQLPACPIDEYTVVAIPPAAPEILRIHADGSIDLAVVLGLDAADGGRRQELQLRAVVDEAGTLVAWQCGELDRPHGDLQPCGP